jgi:hypothetical protein
MIAPTWFGITLVVFIVVVCDDGNVMPKHVGTTKYN